MNEDVSLISDYAAFKKAKFQDQSPVHPEQAWRTMKSNMQYGVVTINEARDAQGLPAIPWGDKPSLPENQVQPE